MPNTLPTLHRRAAPFVLAPCPETTILVCPDGKLRTFSFPYHQQQARVVVRDFPAGVEIASANWPTAGTAGGTAIVANGAVHVFAAVPFVGVANAVVHAVFDNDWVLSAPQTVFTAIAPDNVCNLGITASPFGYIMSVETQQPTRQVFFLRSTDLNTWTPIGTPWATGAYLGSPKIYWSQRRGCFFVTFLVSEGGKFFTRVAKVASDLNSYQVAADALVYPDGVGETVNTSDMTIAEQNGVTHIIYLDGNQTAYTNYRGAVFLGTLEELWEQFFPFETASNPPPSPPASGNVLPQMTGATTSGVTISASDQYTNNERLPWHAADRNAATFYHCDNAIGHPHWWLAAFPAPVTITSYAIKCRDNLPAQAPKDFSLMALVNGTWVNVDQRSGVTGYQSGVFKEFAVSSPVAASSFRLFVTANVEGSVNLAFGEVELRA